MSENTSVPTDTESATRRRDRSLATGLAWTATARWSSQILSWASTVFVARLLTPDDYGIVGMATIYLGVVQLVSEFGLGTAIIQRETLDEGVVSLINGFSVMLGVAMFAVSLAAAPLIAFFFGEPEVTAVVVALATTYIITSFQVVPGALLARAHDFRRLALIESAEALTTTAVTLACAIAGAGYWALVAGAIAGKIVNATLSLAVRGHRLTWPQHFSQMGEALTFGSHVVAARMTWYVYSTADFAVIGRMLGKAALGAYSFGREIASLPADKVSGILARVMVPVFAEVQRDLGALQRYVVRISEALIVVALPASIGMALVSRDFVLCFLGDHWSEAVIPLALLSVHVTVRVITALFSHVLVGIGETRQNVRVGTWLLVAMPVLFIIGAKLWGPPGVALMWLVGHPVVSFPALIAYVSRRIEMPLSRIAEAFRPAIVATAVMSLAVASLGEVMSDNAHPGIRLAATVAAGVCVYPAVLWGAYRERMRSLLGTLRHLRK